MKIAKFLEWEKKGRMCKRHQKEAREVVIMIGGIIVLGFTIATEPLYVLPPILIFSIVWVIWRLFGPSNGE
jgi:hypothetical protein